MLEQAAKHVKALVEKKPGACIALSTEEDCLRLYERIAGMCEQGEISFAGAKFFSVTEFCGLEDGDGRACKNRLRSSLLNSIGADRENCFFITEEDAGNYDELIEKAGGIDLAVLGIGANARIGFNEPATPFDTLSHRQKLTASTRRELADTFESEENVPEYAVTMGIKSLVSARDIVVLSSGESHADAVFKMLYGRNDSVVPAAFLQIPMNVAVYLDEASAQKL